MAPSLESLLPLNLQCVECKVKSAQWLEYNWTVAPNEMTETTLLVNIEPSYTESQEYTQYFTKIIHTIIVKYGCSTDIRNNEKDKFPSCSDNIEKQQSVVSTMITCSVLLSGRHVKLLIIH